MTIEHTNADTPGSRHDGFRFDYLILLAIATPIYLAFELSFNARLLDIIGSDTTTCDIDAIEKWGRIISGVAVSLFVLKLLLDRWEKHAVPLPTRILGTMLAVVVTMMLTYWAEDWWIEREVHQANAAERWQAANLALIRRSIGSGTMQLEALPLTQEEITSPEGKAFLALFPMFGMTFAASGIETARPAVLRNVVQIELNKRLGPWPQPYNDKYRGMLAELKKVWEKPYRGLSLEYAQTAKRGKPKLARQQYDAKICSLLGHYVPPGLGERDFMYSEGVAAFMRDQFQCKQCKSFGPEMTPERFRRDVYDVMYAEQLRSLEASYRGDAASYGDGGANEKLGKDGARAYWVPFWALMFSIVGALTHTLKSIALILEYLIRRMNAHIADTAFMHTRINWLWAGLFVAIVGTASSAYWMRNSITNAPFYQKKWETLVEQYPISARIMHWVINVQHFAYPKMEWIREHMPIPGGLRYDSQLFETKGTECDANPGGSSRAALPASGTCRRVRAP